MIFSENYRLRPCGAEACELSNPRREVTGCIVEINPVPVNPWLIEFKVESPDPFCSLFRNAAREG
jgi:hypothetical protein